MSFEPLQDAPQATPAVQVMDLPPAAVAALLHLARSLGFDAVRIDLEGCDDKAGLLERTAAALGFPAWFGGNWDAFFDCLTDLGWRQGRGHVLVFANTGGLRRHAPEALETAITILADAAAAWDERGRVFRAFVGSE